MASLHESFLLKDIYTRGLDVARQTSLTRDELTRDEDSSDVLAALTAMDEAFDENDKPNLALCVWMGLSRLMINAGDVLTAAVAVRQVADGRLSWDFGLNMGVDNALYQRILATIDQRLDYYSTLEAGPLSFLKLYQVVGATDAEQGVVDMTSLQPAETLFSSKTMGPVDPSQYISKLGAYPLSVNPAIGRRSIASLHFMLINALQLAGLLVVEHWFPEDTGQGFARYVLSDGLDYFLLDYDAPLLEIIMAEVDAYAGRDESDGAVFLTPLAPVEESQTQDTGNHEDDDPKTADREGDVEAFEEDADPDAEQ